MKTHKIIVVLLILLGVSAYANDNEVEGFTEDDCDGDSHVATSYSELKDMHESNDNEWEFKSYWYTSNKNECLEYEEDMEEIVVIGQRLPGSSSGSGGGGGGNSTGGVSTPPSQGSHGVGGPPDPAEEFTEEMHEQLKDCWLDKAAESADVRGWVGKQTDATWRDDTTETWTSETPAEDLETMGNLDYTIDPMAVYIFPKNISRYATENNIPFDHLVMYVQMEEFIHVLQVTAERNDDDEHDNPTKADKLAYEIEAKSARNKFWLAIFGIEAPFHPPADSIPEQYDEDRERYNELLIKEENGTLVVDPDADPPIDEVAELANLDSLFDDVNEDIYPDQDPNESYDTDADLGCAEETENGDENGN